MTVMLSLLLTSRFVAGMKVAIWCQRLTKSANVLNNGDFYLTILVANPGGSSGGFETVINGVSFGQIDYDQTFYEYGPLDGDCETIDEINVTEWEDETCTLTTVLNDPVCCANCDNFIVDYV